MPCVYVGQTALTSEARLNNHLIGNHGGHIVRRFGRHVLASGRDFATEEAAEREEKRVAARLRRCGFTVFGGT